MLPQPTGATMALENHGIAIQALAGHHDGERQAAPVADGVEYRPGNLGLIRAQWPAEHAGREQLGLLQRPAQPGLEEVVAHAASSPSF